MLKAGASAVTGARSAAVRALRGKPARATIPPSRPGIGPRTFRSLPPVSLSRAHQDFASHAHQEAPRIRLPAWQENISFPVSAASRAMRILFLTNAHNGMSQALYLNLTGQGHQVMLHVAQGEKDMLAAHDTFLPDVIVAPFLTKRVPERLWKNNATCPVLIVHPGVRGDRGVSAIDWALKQSAPEWGVTVLQADEEMDAGDVWKSSNFFVPESSTLTKSAFYNKLCVPAAVAGVQAALEKLQNGVPPRALDYSHSDVTGTLQPVMKLADRAVDWSRMSAQEAAQTVRFSDSSPGCPHAIGGTKYRLFGAHPEGRREAEEGVSLAEEVLEKATSVKPGEPVGQRDGAVLFKCSDGTGLWISHMKRVDSKKCASDNDQKKTFPFKLPSTSVLPEEIVVALPVIPTHSLYVPFGERPLTFQEVWVSVDQEIAYVHNDFYNGAASTSQCERLTAAIQEVSRRDDVKVVLLMGGEYSYGNGINLNTIEASEDPRMESWHNINAINDSIKESFSITDKVVVSVMRGNAGAGGAMAAMASDVVWAHESIILNPHYKAMELTGGEYWTYFLKERVGEEAAAKLTNSTRPITAHQALGIGMVDDLMRYSPSSDFLDEACAIRDRAHVLVASGLADELVAKKQRERDAAWFERVEAHRTSELVKMQECFSSPWYHDARRRFVYKSPAVSSTPPHMVKEAAIPALQLDGQLASTFVRKQVKTRIALLSKNESASDDGTDGTDGASSSKKPGLGIVMANGRPDSSIYVDAKIRAAKMVGMNTTLVNIPTEGLSPTALEAMVVAEVRSFNKREDIDGIVVQMPLPVGVDSDKVVKAIAVHKDADACHPNNSVFEGGAWSSAIGVPSGGSRKEFRPLPCTPHGIVVLLAMHGVHIVGKTVVVIGKSKMVGQPVAAMLSSGGATVTQCDVHTDRVVLERKIRNADIVVSAAGRAGLVKGHWIRPGAVVVDVAMNAIGVTADGKRKVVGDVEYNAARAKASYITPVPGGVGPMTVALLLQNTLDLFEAHRVDK